MEKIEAEFETNENIIKVNGKKYCNVNRAGISVIIIVLIFLAMLISSFILSNKDMEIQKTLAFSKGVNTATYTTNYCTTNFWREEQQSNCYNGIIKNVIDDAKKYGVTENDNGVNYDYWK